MESKLNINTTRNFKGAPSKPVVKSTPAKVAEAPQDTEPRQDPWSIMVEFEMPRPAQGESNMMQVKIGDYEAYLPRGKKITAPKPVYQLLKRITKAEDAHRALSEELQGNFKIGER